MNKRIVVEWCSVVVLAIILIITHFFQSKMCVQNIYAPTTRCDLLGVIVPIGILLLILGIANMYAPRIHNDN